MFNCGPDSIVYVMCPPNIATGGPELLHQLCNALNIKGINAVMYYFPSNAHPLHPEYIKYNTKYATNIIDSEKNYLIIPEVFISTVNNQFDLKLIKKCIWWLSIDNYFIPLKEDVRKFKLYKIGVHLDQFFTFRKNYLNKNVIKDASHLVQSLYAEDFLKKCGIKSNYLSDYLNEYFIRSNEQIDLTKKENIVLYNPKKGYKFTKKIMRNSKHLNWLPLENMSREEVANLLKRAKVYIDFGEHPGKDRFPREAAISMCCLITGRKGSANYTDVDIPAKYKIMDRKENIDSIIALIEDCFANFEQNLCDFDNYRNIIKKEEKEFLNDIDNIFIAN